MSQPFITLVLSPVWWTKVRWDASGAIPLALKFAVQAIRKTDLRLRELRATSAGLFLDVEAPAADELPQGAESIEVWARSVGAMIESEITLEAEDYRDGAESPAVSRDELEAKLRELGFESDPAGDATGKTNRSLWTLASVGSASCYVGLTRYTSLKNGQGLGEVGEVTLPNDNVATWGDAQGERTVDYAAVMAKLGEFEGGGMVDHGKPRAGGVFEELGPINPFSQVGKHA